MSYNPNSAWKPSKSAEEAAETPEGKVPSFTETMKDMPENPLQELHLGTGEGLPDDTTKAPAETTSKDDSPESRESAEDEPFSIESVLEEFSSPTTKAIEKADAINKNLEKEIEKLNAELAKKQADKATVDAEVSSLQETLGPIDKQIAELSKNTEPKWTYYFNAIGAAAIALAKEKFKKPAARDLTATHDKLNGLFSDWRQNKEEIEKLEKGVTEDRSKLAEKQTESSELSREIAALESQIRQLKDDQDTHSGRLKELKDAEEVEKQEFVVRREREHAEAELAKDGGIEGYRSRIEQQTKHLEAERDRKLAGVEARAHEHNRRLQNAEYDALLGLPTEQGDPISEEKLEAIKESIRQDYERQIGELKSQENKDYDRLFPVETRRDKIKGLFSKLNFVKAQREMKKKELVAAFASYYNNMKDSQTTPESS